MSGGALSSWSVAGSWPLRRSHLPPSAALIPASPHRPSREVSSPSERLPEVFHPAAPFCGFPQDDLRARL